MPRRKFKPHPSIAPAVPGKTKYDAHHEVLTTTYGNSAELRRELSDSKETLRERTALLQLLAHCTDVQRAYLLFDDYLEKLALRRADFGIAEWWTHIVAATGPTRLEEVAMLFLRAKRSLPTELVAYANLTRFAAAEQAAAEDQMVAELERWWFPPDRPHLDEPRASLRLVAEPRLIQPGENCWNLSIRFFLMRQRTGEKERTVAELCDLRSRAAHEAELYTTEDWQVIDWLRDHWGNRCADGDALVLRGGDLLTWLTEWGQPGRIELFGQATSLSFQGRLAEFHPQLRSVDGELYFTHLLRLPGGELHSLPSSRFFEGEPTLVLVDSEFFLVRKPPPPAFLGRWTHQPQIPVRRLPRRVLVELRQDGDLDRKGAELDQWCQVHRAAPRFIFELTDDLIRVRLVALSERDGSEWHWQGHEWARAVKTNPAAGPLEFLDDPRLAPAIHWLQREEWFTPEPGLWVLDSNETTLARLAEVWSDRPESAEFLGNPAFQRLFTQRRLIKPKLALRGSGIDWLSVSAEWETEGLRLTAADLKRLATATTRFVKLPDGGWAELDVDANRQAHETAATLGLIELTPEVQKTALLHATQLNEAELSRLGSESAVASLKSKLENFTGVRSRPVPTEIQAEVRPYQQEGFEFLCHLTTLRLGGVLADDMGLGKTLQALCWLSWLHGNAPKKDPKPSLVLCPASVLYNWQREAARFAPHLKVLVLQSGAARHDLRSRIPEFDIVVTNYAILRRDLEALGKIKFRALLVDEAQFIKNPEAQVTLAVKELTAEHRLALTGTPLENRLLDLWSIIDFCQPGYLGTQTQFHANYEPAQTGSEWEPETARRRLSAKLRPLLLRRLKKQVAQDLPERIEERRDCVLDAEQRKLYLAELRRSREQVQKAIQEVGPVRSRMHVLAALTRLRQICCHPRLIGNDAPSGKTDTLFELLEPLLQAGNKILLFSQFVKMLRLLETACRDRGFRTHLLTGETKDRPEVVTAFQADPEPCVFLLSLRAAGTGLNLTTASYVILYDPWWNPAVEAQAIDRSHRIGQTRTVNAYRLIAAGTVEEKIWELQQRKSQQIADVLGEEGFAKHLTKDDLNYLFQES